MQWYCRVIFLWSLQEQSFYLASPCTTIKPINTYNMFIDSLYLITVLATQCPEAITEIGDDYIIIDTKVCKDIIEELQNPFVNIMSSISEIAYLPPLENEAETFAYPYVKRIKLDPSVLIARAHFRKDFKSSKKISFNFFHKNNNYRRVLRGESSFCMYLCTISSVE